MISNAAKRSILRWIHLVLSIPILSYIYGPISEVQQYAGAIRFVFVPVILLSGIWMYSGAWLAIIGIAVWLGAFCLSGFWPAILGEVVLLIGWKIWLRVRAQQSKRAAAAVPPPTPH